MRVTDSSADRLLRLPMGLGFPLKSRLSLLKGSIDSLGGRTISHQRFDGSGDLAMKRVAIVQSNYIPWKGYFDLIASVDEFVLYDDMQFTRRDWRNRNKIKTAQGVQWLSVPVKVKGRHTQAIRDTEIDGVRGQGPLEGDHPQLSTRPHFSEIASWLEPVLLGAVFDALQAQPHSA